MTHDDVQQLQPGPDLDAFVARTLGLPLAPYSRDIGAAWQALEAVDWPNVVVRRLFSPLAPSLSWLCLDDTGEWATVGAWAPTPELAICRAVLVYVTSKQQEAQRDPTHV